MDKREFEDLHLVGPRKLMIIVQRQERVKRKRRSEKIQLRL